MSDVIIQVEGLTRVFKQGSHEVHALKGVDLTIHRGDFACLAGSSGSGKTTMLNIIGALDVPTGGTVTIDGQRLVDYSGKQLSEMRLRRIGFVFQAYNLIPVLTAYENAEYVLLLQGVPEAERREKVLSVMKAVGIDGLENRLPGELSGGQQQRVAVARAIASAPALVLADEPTANLDSKTGTELIELMQRLNKERNVTFLISSHDPKVIDRAQRVIRLEDGRVLSDERRPSDVAA